MPTDPISRKERDARDALAELLEGRSAEIIVRWLEVLEAEVVTKHMTLTELRNGIASYLEQLAAVLRSEVEIVPGGVDAWEDVAREHAITRVRQGFDVSQLVHEFIVLRRIIFEMVEQHDSSAGLARQGMILADLVGAAIADSVASYVEARDFAARRAHAEHVGFVTHELRNPLSAAMTAAARLASQPEVAATSGSVLTLLQRSLDRLRGLVDRVLETKRLEAGELTPKTTDIRLGALMDEALRVARKRAEDKGLRFRARYDPEKIVCVDTQLSVSALQNVVDNAVKFTDVGEVQVTAEDRDHEIIIHVRDNCHGLSEPELATIFEPFARGHTGKPGTGLGLTIARRSIEAQGGTVGAESPGERGCHFWLTMPKPKA